MDKKEGKLRDFSKQLFPCRVKLNEFTEGVVTMRVGCLFQYFTTRVEKDNFLRRH